MRGASERFASTARGEVARAEPERSPGVLGEVGTPSLERGQGGGEATAAAAPTTGVPLGISLLTFSPGALYWERFGHNAILVRDAAGGSALAYNYGLFDFQQKNFFLNFARGRMRYKLGVGNLEDMLWYYGAEGRGIVEQRLNLTPAQRAALDAYLRWNAQPENAQYRYDYFLANCSTRVRDALDRALGGALRPQLEGRPTGTTFRSEAVRLLSPDLGFAMLMDFVLGPAADRPIDEWQRAYVPAALMASLRHLRVRGEDGAPQPLVSSERELLEPRLADAPAQAPDWTAPLLAAGVGLAASMLLLGLARESPAARVGFAGLSAFIALLFGLAGVLMLGIWTLTEHWAGAHNPLLLVFSPLCLLLLPDWWRARRKDWQPTAMQRLLTVILLLLGLAAPILSLFGPGAAARHWMGLGLPVLLAWAWIVHRHASRTALES